MGKARDLVDVICLSDGLTSIAAQGREAWQARRARRIRAYGVLLGITEDEATLAALCDAVMPPDDLHADLPALTPLSAV